MTQEKSDLVPAKTAAALLGVSVGQFSKMAQVYEFERFQVSSRRVKYSWSDVLERAALTTGMKAMGFVSAEETVFIDQKEASRRLGVAVNTFRSHAARVGLTRHKIGKRGVRYRWGEVVEKLAQVQF